MSEPDREMRNTIDAEINDPRMGAAVRMIGRTGADDFQIRFCEEEMPVVWMALASWDGQWNIGSAFTPLRAVFRLCDLVIDGGKCVHCQRPTGFTEDFEPMPAQQMVCWYQWDPETKEYRRSCE
jgi:hypothetical protein